MPQMWGPSEQSLVLSCCIATLLHGHVAQNSSDVKTQSSREYSLNHSDLCVTALRIEAVKMQELARLRKAGAWSLNRREDLASAQTIAEAAAGELRPDNSVCGGCVPAEHWQLRASSTTFCDAPLVAHPWRYMQHFSLFCTTRY